MLNLLDLRGVTDFTGRLPRPSVDEEGPVEVVRGILSEVQSRGDQALREFTSRFDGVELRDLRVSAEEMQSALESLAPELRKALELARDRIADHHRSQLHEPVEHGGDGVHIRSYRTAVERAGCYVPGGRAAYPSTLLMTAVPALVAGVQEVVVCVPADKATGRVAAVTLAAAALAGVTEVYAIGGAQAIAAMAYGTEWEESVAESVSKEVSRLTEASPRRAEIAATLAEGGYAVLVDSPEAALQISNLVAPEHLELWCRDAESLVPLIKNAGAVFVGPWSPASVGDYVAGPSHVLPTFGTARFASALTVDDFLKQHHIISVDESAYDPGGLAGAVEALADAEGLTAHADSIRLRDAARASGEFGSLRPEPTSKN